MTRYGDCSRSPVSRTTSTSADRDVSPELSQRSGDGFERWYDGATETLNAARTHFAAWLDERSVGVDRTDVTLALSELCSNAIEASPGEPYLVRGHTTRDRLVVAVANRSAATLPSRCDWTPRDVLVARGRGLSIVEMVSDDVEVQASEGFVKVTAVFSLTR